MIVAIGILIVILIDALIIFQFWRWRQARIRAEGLAYCVVCGDFAKVCCSDKAPKGEISCPRCFECCDHTHSPEERE